jgi:hypothetical protein
VEDAKWDGRGVPCASTEPGEPGWEEDSLPPPPMFLAKSAELHEKKRVEFSLSAKKCKRVRKLLKTKKS